MHRGSLFVLLGASNLARGYYALSQHISQHISGSTFVNAFGPGRGYCTRGGLLNFTYSPIGESQVIESAKVYADQGFRVTVLFTDIGNDIMYGVPEQFFIEYLDSLIEKSLRLNAEVFVTSIHVDVYKDMGKTTFKLLKTVFYPNSLMTLYKADAAVKKTNNYLKNKSAQNERVHLVDGLGAFCGIDKIHYSFFKSHFAWSRVANAIFLSLGAPPGDNIGLGSMAASLCKNLNHLINFDIFKVKKKPKGFF